MRRLLVAALGGLAIATAQPIAQQPADPIKTASDTIGAGTLKTLRFTGFGASYSVGQSPNPSEPWPRVTVKNYEVLVNYDTPAQQIDLTREQGPIPPRGGGQPFVGDQRQQLFVSGDLAWNVAFAAPAPPAANAPAGRGSATTTAQAPQAAPGAVAERLQQIWTTPHGFLKAAMANKGTAKPGASGTEIAFAANGRRYTGIVNAANQVERVRTWLDSPVVGDMLVETVYSSYQKFDGGVMFPMRIVQHTGGHPSLDLWISSATPNAMGTIEVPEAVKTAAPPAPPRVEAQQIADSVYWLTGGSHHSVAIAMRDHVIVVEGPLNEERALAVIAKVKETLPNKPIRFVVNTHHHFDHAGGLRPFVAEGATVVTHQSNRAFYDTAWAAPRTIAPDTLVRAKKTPVFRTVADRAMLTDGARRVEIHRIVDSLHTDGFLMVYLPAEKILIEADAYTPGPAAAAPASSGAAAAVSPTTLNLYQNVQRLKLGITQIAPLHGPRVASLDDLARAAGRSGTN